MSRSIKIVSITADVYPAYYQLVQTSTFGNPMLPLEYSSSLWGDVVMDADKVIGGWIGTLRGDIPIAKIITKSVYFDAYPIFASDELRTAYQDTLIQSIRQHAKNDGITMLNLTHWVRGHRIPLDRLEKCATFSFDLSISIEELYAKLDRLKKRTIKKAESSNLELHFLHKEEALKYIDDFQYLRFITQERAIKRNSNASMLLKSSTFFKHLFCNFNTFLVTIHVDDKLVAAATFIVSGKTVYAHMSGSDAEYNKSIGSGTYYYWAAVKYFKEKGFEIFDFGGCPVSPNENHPAYGVYSFKKGFGGEYKEYDAGKIIISSWKFKLLNWILSQRKLLRLFSKKL